MKLRRKQAAQVDRKMKISELVCLCCMGRWIEERDAKICLKEMKCPNCEAVGGVIETGEDNIFVETAEE